MITRVIGYVGGRHCMTPLGDCPQPAVMVVRRHAMTARRRHAMTPPYNDGATYTAKKFFNMA
jgi:hypothetical protein